MNLMPDPRRVRSRDDFIAFVEAMEASLDAALLEPEPGPWEDERGGWTNWINRWKFWEAMTGWLAAEGRDGLAGEPIGHVLLEGVPEPSAEQWSDPESLRAFLRSIREWAASPSADGSPDMWRRAAEAMRAGATYE